jgi:hypothetical protein
MGATPVPTSTPATTNFPYLSYVDFVGNIAIIVTSLAAIANNSRLLSFAWFQPSRLKVKQVQPALLFYLITHLVCLVAWLPHHCYMVLRWSAVPAFDYQLVFWTGFPVPVYMATVPIPFFLLTVDRILSLKPYLPNERFLRRVALRFSCLLQVAVAIVTAFVSTWGELPLDLQAIEGCAAYLCVLRHYRNLPVLYFRNSVETVNLVLAVYFTRLLRARELSATAAWGQQKHHRESHLRNRLVRNILMAEICVSMLPTYLAYAINIVSAST